MQQDCTHKAWRYTRRAMASGQIHFIAQCTDCGSGLKLERHNGKLWLKLEDIPEGELIYTWVQEVRS